MDDYEIGKDIGEGGFGLVCMVTHKKTGEVYAAKTMYSTGEDVNKQIQAEKEMIDLQKIISPYLVKYIDYFPSDEDEKINYIIMEYCPGGDLHKLIGRFNKSAGFFSFPYMMRIVAGCLVGLYVLHCAHILHRDIKPQNIFVLNDGRDVKIGDFGTKKGVKDTFAAARNTIIGTLGFMAPEVIRGDPYGLPADIFSMGMVFFQLLTVATSLCKMSADKDRTTSGSSARSTISGASPSLQQTLTESKISPSSRGSPPLTPPQQIKGAKTAPPTLRELLDSVVRPDVPHEFFELILQMSSEAPQARPTHKAILQFPLIRKAVLALPWSSLPPQLLADYGLTGASDPNLKGDTACEFPFGPLVTDPVPIAAPSVTGIGAGGDVVTSVVTVMHTSPPPSTEVVTVIHNSPPPPQGEVTAIYTPPQGEVTAIYTPPV